MRKAYIVAAKRSAIGTFLGSLTDVDLATVGATVLKETIKQANIDPANLDEVIIGNVIAAGLGQNIARHVAFDAGIPVEVCAQSINMLCGSGLKAVMEATLRIQANFGDLYVAGQFLIWKCFCEIKDCSVQKAFDSVYHSINMFNSFRMSSSF